MCAYTHLKNKIYNKKKNFYCQAEIFCSSVTTAAEKQESKTASIFNSQMKQKSSIRAEIDISSLTLESYRPESKKQNHKTGCIWSAGTTPALFNN